MDDLGIRKTVDNLLPACGGAVVRLIDNDHVEEIVGKLRQPFVDVGGELLDVRDDNVRFGRDRKVAAIERARERSRYHLVLAQHARLPPKAFLAVGNIHRVVQPGLDSEIGRDDDHATGGKSEGKKGSEAGFATADGYLKDRLVLAGAEELVGAKIAVALRVAQVIVCFDLAVEVEEERFDGLVRADPRVNARFFKRPFLTDLSRRYSTVAGEGIERGLAHTQIGRCVFQGEPVRSHCVFII